MALIVEDGTGRTDSQTYATVADLDAYALLRGVTLSAPTEVDKEVLLVKSIDYLESLGQSYGGKKGTQEQALQFPRTNLKVDGYYVNSSSVPKGIKDAQMIGAMLIDSGEDLQPSLGPKVLSERVEGAISVTYSESSSRRTSYSQLAGALGKFLSGGSNAGTSFSVSR